MNLIEQIRSDIESNKVKINDTKEELDSLIKQFETEMLPKVKEWIDSEVKNKIVNNAKEINTGGEGLINEIKTDLSELISKLPEICRIAVGSTDMWPHRKVQLEMDAKSSKQNQVPGYILSPLSQTSFFEESFRRAINSLGDILNKYNLLYESTKGGSTWEKSTTENTPFRYTINTGFNAKSFQVLVKYNSLLTVQIEQLKKNEEMNEKLEKEIALKNWDS